MNSLRENPLRFWKKYSYKFPGLAKLSKQIFSIPAASTSSERIFSRMKLILQGNRFVKDSEIVKVLRKMKKQRQESADLYQKGGRQELSHLEESEIKIIDSFLPSQLSEEETKKICKEVIESLGA